MNYELAKELKETGFPLKSYTCVFGDHEALGPCDKCRPDIPTLEELIEACGQQFHSLINSGATGWDACEFKEPFADTFPMRVNGPTPAEAVARLWLALNRKENGS